MLPLRPAAAKHSISRPSPILVACSRRWNAQISHRARIALAKTACPCTTAWAGLRGKRCPDARSWRDTSPRPWDTPRVCWGAIPRAFPSLGPSRWAWRASGVAGSARSTPVTWPSPWAPWRARARRWSTGGGSCPKQGPRTRLAWTKLAGPTPTEGRAHGTRGRWTWCRPVARGCRMGGARALTRGGVRRGCVAGSMAGVSALGGRGRATR
jgi:hypothetical protein